MTFELRVWPNHGEHTGENRVCAVRAGDDGVWRDDRSSYDRLGDDNAPFHRFQEGPKEWWASEWRDTPKNVSWI